ncbi:MAG: cell surface protein SprA [Bacteroidota bacterium]
MSKFSIALLISAVVNFFVPEEITPDPSVVETVDTVVTQFELPPTVISVDGDTSKPKNPNNHVGDATRQPYVSPINLKNPGNVQITFELTEDGKGYYIYERVGGVDIKPPSYISFEDYLKYRREKGMDDYYREQSLASNEEAEQQGLIPTFDLGKVGDIFGGGTVEIRPTGFATLNFSLDRNRTENPALPLRQQRVTTFNFDQQIQLGVVGKIGEKLRLNTTFDTKATFDFENQLKLEHSGNEDQILQKIEAGNVSMPLGNSLIQGRQNLFGLKTQLRFGPVNISAVASTERGQVETISVAGGGGIETPFEKSAAEYDEYRHFFLSHYFRSRYEAALSNPPQVNSGVRINRIEVWINNARSSTTQNNRSAIGLIDIGENEQPARDGGLGVIFNDDAVTSSNTVRFPDNSANDLYAELTSNPDYRNNLTAPDLLRNPAGLNFREGFDFERANNMRRLNPNEYNFDPQLGYISLNQKTVANQVLFVAFEYTLNGQTYQVGEFSQDVPANGTNTNVLFLKMLKPGSVKPTFTDVNNRVRQFPTWDLMMKNIYNIGYGIQRENFFLDIKYESGTSAGKINFLPTGAVQNQLLIQVTNLDQLTNHTAPNPDNYFDFIEGRTIIPDRGLVIFPVLEPFGDWLDERLENNPDDSVRYVFSALYDQTRVDAIQFFPQLNRFYLEGFYRSAGGADIPLNTFNLAEGSVTVTANGRPLTEGQDYIVDYFGGKVTIINEAILTSGQRIDVSFESSSLYNVQTKTLIGTRAEFSPSDKISLGATLLNLNERPFTQKTTFGDEPINNTLWGVDGALRTDSRFLTKMVDALPLISTKAPSNVTGAAEFAQFIPGQPRQIRTDRDRSNVFLDDFEASKTPFSMQGINRWKLAALPNVPHLSQGQNDPLGANFNRAKLAWYQIDQAFYQGFQVTIPEEDLQDNYTRLITPNEIFPLATRAFGATIQPTFDLHYIPNERGPYNYRTSDIDPLTGRLLNPRDNWAGITRQVDVNNDFEATNVEFLEFWLMDPFMDEPNHTGGQMYFNIGRVSEDVLPDAAIAVENGLPVNENDLSNIINTDWGRVPLGLPPNNAFSTDPDERTFQDVGFDGLSDENERVFFSDSSNFLPQMEAILGPNNPAYRQLVEDPSSDNFLHFRDDIYESDTEGILGRYLLFNGLEGNSPVSTGSQSFTIQATQEPDNEDLNQNGNLSTAEEFYEYRIDLNPSDLIPGQNYVVDSIESIVQLENNVQKEVRWYQFRIPLTDEARTAVGGISNLKSVDFVRMYLTGFDDSVILRMTEFQLVATQWRRIGMAGELDAPGQVGGGGGPVPNIVDFEVGSVSLEENSQKTPFNYQLPPAVNRQAINGNTQAGFLDDERSLLLRTCNLGDGQSRGIFKTVNLDLRNYQRLKMWTHAEAIDNAGFPSNFVDTGDATAFIRLGLDNDQNYYEYEIPLTPSDPFAANPQELANVWPLSNEFDIELSVLGQAKAARNAIGASVIDRFEFSEGLPRGHRIYVVGTPKTSDVRTIVIGVRNPISPDGNPVCLETWVNELRMTDFDQEAGWAANANVNMQLADFGNIQASISNRTPGFGALEQKVSERSQENTFRYDVAGNFRLDKLVPQKLGIQLPVYVTYGEQRIMPRFDPREADVRTESLIERAQEGERDETRRQVEDYTRTRSVSFNNVRKMRTGQNQKKHFWDIENFDFTFAYNELFSRNAFTERRFMTQHRGGINYRHTFEPFNIKPFSRWSRKNPLSLINFNPVPTSVSVSITGNRQFEERRMRAGNTFGGEIEPTFSKNFLLNRNYNLTWKLTESINLNFTATNNSRVDEVRGYFNDTTFTTQRERDSVGTLSENLLKIGRDTANGHNNLINMGRTIGYNHNLTLTYQLPFSKYPWTDFINGNVNYSATFRWDQAPENNPALGATISNSQNIQTNGRLDLKKLYTKIKPIKKLMDDMDKKRREKERERRARQNGTELPKKKDEADTTRQLRFLRDVGSELIRMALSIQSVDLNYSQNNSTVLPGYMGETDNFGIDFNYRDPFGTGSPTDDLPPTLGFLVGSQRDIRELAGENGWISRDTNLFNFFAQNRSEQLSGRTSVEIFRGFRVDLSVTRNRTEQFSELFRWQDSIQAYSGSDAILNGNFTMSYIFAGTAFERNADRSDAFETFSQNRSIISDRLAERNPNTPLGPDVINQAGINYRNGYSGENQEVLIPALLSAYGISSPERVELSSFPRLPLPNWSVNYNGLTNVPALKKFFNSVTLRHTYRGTYTVGTYANNLRAEVGENGFVNNGEVKTDDDGTTFEDFYGEENIQAVQISEQFAPLIGLNMNWKNGVTSSIDYKTGRQMTFSTGTMQLTENRNQDLSVMIGYRKDRLNWQFRAFGKDINLKNSLNSQLRVTMRDNRERNRTLDSDIRPIYTRGNFNLMFSPSIDYVVNTRINVRLFYEQNITRPYTSNSFRTAFSSGGVQIRFQLAN